MKVLLVHSASNRRDDGNERKGAMHPLGLAYLASVLEQNDIEVKILDALIEGYDNEEQVRSGFIRYGLPRDKIADIIKEYRPTVVGVSSVHAYRYYEFMEVLEDAKKIDKEIVTVIGGSYSNYFWNDCINLSYIDYVIIGEAEYTFLQLIQNIKNRDFDKNKLIDGIAFKFNGETISRPKSTWIKKIDTIPFPAYHLLPIEKYWSIGVGAGNYGTKRYATMITSRGCPHSCEYCGKGLTSRPGYSQRSANNVFQEILELKKKYNINEIQFEDYNATVNRPRWIELCNLLINADLGITWSITNGMNVSTLDKEMLEICANSGCDALYLAIENHDQEFLDKMGKGVKKNHVEKVIKISKDLNIKVTGFFMIGNPNEPIDSMNKTVEWAKTLGLDYANFFIACPLPGSQFYEQSLKDNLLIENFHPSRLRYGLSNFKSRYFSSEQIEKYRYDVWMDFKRSINNDNIR
ncbi:MAG: B12-binding domain-containing radical SAM protein [Oligoflexia bacterium]|nr:B12-binding domain-containing radical SAM protein [Oligoflexia bacterium]